MGAAKHLVKSQCGIEDVINAVHEVLGDAPNANAQANIATLNATATPEGKEAANKVTPLTQPVTLNMPSAPSEEIKQVETSSTTLVEPQNPNIPAPDSKAEMPSSQDMPAEKPSIAESNAEHENKMEATPISAAPVEAATPAQTPAQVSAPAQPVAPQTLTQPSTPATPQMSAAPQAPAAQPVQTPVAFTQTTTEPSTPAQTTAPQMPTQPSAPVAPQAPAQPNENPVNFNQAPVAQPVAVPAMPNAQAQLAAGANLPAGTQMVALTPQQVLQMAGYGMASMPGVRPMQNMPGAQGVMTNVALARAAAPLPMPAMPGMARVTPEVYAQMQAARAQQSVVRSTQRIAPGSKPKNSGERILQPIHDKTQDRMREQMQKAFTDLLGDEDPSGPQAVSTKSAKQNTPSASMKVPTAAQASLNIPTPQIKTAAPAQPSAPTQTAPAAEQSKTPAQETAQQQAPVAAPQQVKIDPNLTIADMASIAPPVEEQTQANAIRPAYVSSLEDQLSKDLASTDGEEDSMAARMMAELADDEITESARAIADSRPKEKAQEPEIELPQSIAGPNISSPNISSPNIS